MSAARPRVLIIDDATAAEVLYGKYLAGLDVERVYAPTLTAAQALLREQRFACVILDLGLPDGYGVELLAAVREAGDMVPVIIVTGLPSPRSQHDAEYLGVIAYLEKPLDSEVLRHHVTTAIGRP